MQLQIIKQKLTVALTVSFSLKDWCSSMIDKNSVQKFMTRLEKDKLNFDNFITEKYTYMLCVDYS